MTDSDSKASSRPLAASIPASAVAISLSAAVLVGSFLLFTLEPLVGKSVTPGFGGTAGVWSVCLLFFQIALLGGYLLAYSLARTPVVTQAACYAIFLVLSLLLGELPGRGGWVAHQGTNPALALMALLCLNIGLPFVALSSVSVLLQTWYRRLLKGNPYPLYAVSNVGSLAALAAFPTLLEPSLSLTDINLYWTWAYRALVLLLLSLCLLVALDSRGKQAHSDQAGETEGASAPGALDIASWIYLSAGGSIALLSFTTYITQDISPIPLFWILPLALYLLSFVLLFGKPAIYLRRSFAGAWMVLWLSEVFVPRDDFGMLLAVNLILLFAICMSYHGEIVISRPHPRHLPTLYLAMAAGGALGGMYVNFLAPAVSGMYVERELSVVLLAVFTAGLVFRKELRLHAFEATEKNAAFRWQNGLVDVSVLTLVLMSLAMCSVPFFMKGSVIAEERNFYSSVQIRKDVVDGKPALAMVHGRVIHGKEVLSSEARSPGIYWEPVAVALDLSRQYAGGGAINCGIVGLGVGFTAALTNARDRLRFYELDPKVERMAKKHFSYLGKSESSVEIAIGDGRRLLEGESERRFDLLIIDVFNGNAIPVHLLTREALVAYRRHIKPGGVLGFHISNRYLDLEPVLGNIAGTIGLSAATVSDVESTYVLLSRHDDLYERLTSLISSTREYRKLVVAHTRHNGSRVWTDDYVNLLPVFKNPLATGL